MDVARSYERQNSLIEGTFLESQYLSPDYWFGHEVSVAKGLAAIFFQKSVLDTFYVILFFLAMFFLALMSYCFVRMLEIRKKEHAHMHHEIVEYAHHKKEREEKKERENNVSENSRWVRTLTYLFSQSPSDWKLAIIEADAMLEDLLGQLGFKGDTLGDKLKSTDQEKFRNLTSAWEVHTIRNRVAHEGLSYEISQREAKRVIAIYEDIFREYGFI
ncbi:MAG: hypothetical protein AAB510_02670 [Patescibacteria group bacterium]